MFDALNYISDKKNWDKANEDFERFSRTGRNIFLRSSNFVNSEQFASYAGIENIRAEDGTVKAEATNRNSRLLIGRLDNKGNSQGFDYKLEQYYTFSVIFETTNPNEPYIRFGGKYFLKGTTSELGTFSGFLPTIEMLENGLYKAYGTFSVTNRENPEDELLFLYVYPNWGGESEPVTITVHNFKLEKGTTSSPHEIAPEDENVHPLIANLAEYAYRTDQNERKIRELQNAITSQGGGS